MAIGLHPDTGQVTGILPVTDLLATYWRPTRASILVCVRGGGPAGPGPGAAPGGALRGAPGMKEPRPGRGDLAGAVLGVRRRLRTITILV